jgi:YD repeat-containing protein
VPAVVDAVRERNNEVVVCSASLLGAVPPLACWLHHGSCTARTYEANGRLTATTIRRGNIGYIYDRNGRLTSRAVFNSSNTAFRIYDTHGRFISSGSR